MRDISVSSKETTTSQIKCNKQLSDLTHFVQLLSDKFDKHEKKGKTKDELTSKLQTQVTKLTVKLSNLLYKLTGRNKTPGRIAFLCML